VHVLRPENFDERRYGRMTLAEAFAKSINTAAARLAQQVGLNQVIAAARDLGVTAALPAVPSLALGAADMNLLELTAAYAAVKAGKMPIKPWGVAGFGVGRQTRLQSMGPPIGGTQSLQPYQKPLIDLMLGVLRNGTGRTAALAALRPERLAPARTMATLGSSASTTRWSQASGSAMMIIPR
jgi:penicillin-binding protein 1A